MIHCYGVKGLQINRILSHWIKKELSGYGVIMGLCYWFFELYGFWIVGRVYTVLGLQGYRATRLQG